jgi:hypothetical protein
MHDDEITDIVIVSMNTNITPASLASSIVPAVFNSSKFQELEGL